MCPCQIQLPRQRHWIHAVYGNAPTQAHPVKTAVGTVSSKSIEAENGLSTMKGKMNCSQLKEQGKNPEKINNERNNLPQKEFKALLMKMLSKLGKRIDLHNDTFNKDLENIFGTGEPGR